MARTTAGAPPERATRLTGAKTRPWRGGAHRLLGFLLVLVLLAAAACSTAIARPAGPTAAAEPNKAPTVSKQPVSVTVEEGQTASFESAAAGVPAPTVQWELSSNGGGAWSPVAGATSTHLSIPATTTSQNGYQYRAAFANTAGTATSKAAVLSVHRAPALTLQPSSVTINEGQSAVFEAAATGVPAPTVQWETSANGGSSWTNVAGGTSARLTLANVKAALSGHLYRATFKNVAGSAVTEGATLTVRTPPAVTQQPAGTTVEEGQNAVFEAAASGSPAPSVQWEVSTNSGSTWVAVAGATSTKLTISAATTSQSGYEYRAVFANVAGAATTAAATLTVHRAPSVTTQPANATVEEGQSAVFEAAASGTPAPTVQWETSSNGGSTWTNAPAGTAPRLTIANVKAASNGHLYRATFKNVAGSAVSESATLTVEKLPAVSAQPSSVTVEEGQNAVFEASASGIPAPSVQWELSTNGGGTWSPLAGATSNQLTIAATTISQDGYRYRAVFTNAAGSATSSVAVLTVHRAPAVTQQPADATVEEGQNALFEAAASGYPTPTVQWETSANGTTWTAISGATSGQLTIAGAKTSLSGHQYRATFTNAAGKATSAHATLTVQKRPAVTLQPASITVNEGQSAVFEAAASGFPTPTVQWEASIDAGATWSPVAGATSPQLTVAGTTVSEDGKQFRAVFTNAAGTATSNAATLTVHAPPVVIQNPANTTVLAGEEASFEAAASAHPSATVQWERSTNGGATWSAVPGATSTQLAIAKTVIAETGYEFRALFTNVAGKATSAAATLTVADKNFNAVAWGQNLYRQLGDGTFNSRSDVPVASVGLKFVTAVAAGGRHSLALHADGSVVAWGSNEFGQLGDGGTTTSNVPVAVSGLTHAKAIAAGGSHSLALLSDGTVMAWGDNENGQLGIGTNNASEIPVAVKGLSGVKAISAGTDHSLALLNNGTVMAWGANEAGQLGIGGTKASNVPVAVKGLTGVAAISAGGEFSLALLAKGTVQGWGSDQAGQLANSSVAEEGFSSLPVSVGTLSGVTAVAAGAKHGLALLSGGSVMAWGEDAYGQLGNGVFKKVEETPVAVSALQGVTAITAGGQDSAALLGSGLVMSWGSNEWGTLGDGANGAPSPVPVLVSGIGKVASVSAGASHMLAYGEPKPAITGVSPNLGPAAGGQTVTITGANFTGASAVKFGTASATNVTVDSASAITATTPAGSGTVDVSVTTPSGVSPMSSGDHYSYQFPAVVGKMSVKSGPSGGSTSVTITGTEFTGVTSVNFGSTPAAHFTVESPTSITAVSPAGTVGTIHVIITNTAGPSAAAIKDRFTFTPTVSGLSPAAGPAAGGTSVTVTGSGFTVGATATTFKFGTVKSKSVNCTSSTACTVLAPAQPAGTVQVTATVNKVPSPVNPPSDSFTYS